MLTKEQKYLGMRYAMLSVLNAAIDHKDYSCLQLLHELSNINNKELAALVHTKRAISRMPKEAVFTDIAYLIFKKSENNSAIIDAFYEFYSKKHPDLIKKLEKAEKLYIADHAPLNDFPEKPKTTRGVFLYTMERPSFCFFLLFHSNVIDDITTYGFTFESYCANVEFSFLTTDDNVSNAYCRLDTGEDIFTCKQYRTCMEKRKAELMEVIVEHLGASVPDPQFLGEAIHCRMASLTDNEKIDMLPFSSETVKGCSRDLIIERNGGAYWYELITADPKKRSAQVLNYTPDVDHLIDMYYRNAIRTACLKSIYSTGKSITRFALARERLTESPVTDLFCIMYMYSLDGYYKLFTSTLEDYYSNFSWEKITKLDVEKRFSKIIASLEEQLEVRNKKISTLAEQNRVLSIQISTATGVDAHPYEKAIAALNKDIEERDSEILSLKAELASKEQFIELLLSADDEDVTAEINIEDLQAKRYLFVGRASEIAPQLRKVFPGSVFMETENVSIQNLKVDAIVMLIKGMSHKMFYKVNATTSLDGIPVVRCNTRNINTIYQAMAKIIL